jgi:uncharacterized Zn finger protein (UPF0148 family)
MPQEWIDCPACGATGYELDGKTLCRVCGGRKKVPK